MGVENAECAAGETQSTPSGTPRASAISGVTLAAGSTPPWPGLAPCDSFTSIIFTCGSAACAANRSASKRAVGVAAAEVARPDLPDQVAPAFAVIAADRPLARVMREAAELRAPVEREDRVGRQRAEAHGRDVEDATPRRAACRRAFPISHAEVVAVEVQRLRSNGVIHS